MPPEWSFSSVGLIDFGITPSPEPPAGGVEQYGWFDLNIDAAWRLAGGYALVGQVDTGLDPASAALKQFSGTTYLGGGFVPQASRDVGLTGGETILIIPSQSPPGGPAFDAGNVDEAKSMWIAAGPCTSNPNQNAFLPSTRAGHGTHVAGLIAASGAAGLGIQGICRNCGIAMWKTTYLTCNESASPATVYPQTNRFAPRRAEAQTIDLGAQILNMSYGGATQSYGYCGPAHDQLPECLSLMYASSRDIAMVASSGNDRNDLNFPASDARVIAAGGFQQDLALWDESPGGNTGCPLYPPYANECGSDFSVSHSGAYYGRQELLASARQVLSTAYPNKNWNASLACGDGFGTPMGDGVGLCTGTSMSAPQIAGVLAILRSINPLVYPGDAEPVAPAKPGLRAVLAQTASRVGAWDARLGYGIPDAAAAARRMLGTVAGAIVRNRATPLFRLRSDFTKDYAETTSPRYARADDHAGAQLYAARRRNRRAAAGARLRVFLRSPGSVEYA
ncbi:MAG: S8 family peptidase [Dokdonella sp.]|uniref:S8 family peptidase n=1 Tax=Dokdonella sp. TaxID=2291710 RepID=UPI003F80B937